MLVIAAVMSLLEPGNAPEVPMLVAQIVSFTKKCEEI